MSRAFPIVPITRHNSRFTDAFLPNRYSVPLSSLQLTNLPQSTQGSFLQRLQFLALRTPRPHLPHRSLPVYTMAGGPKASAANLEPLGKRRRFGNLADPSSIKTCASPVRDVRGAKDMALAFSGAVDSRSDPILSTARTTTSHTEPKVNEPSSDDTSAQVEKPGVSDVPNADPSSSTTGAAANGPIANAQNAPETRDPMNKAPSPRTRLETSARALALAQDWQAKFKALPKKPPGPNSLRKIDAQEHPVRMASEQTKLSRPDPQPSLVDKSELQGHGTIAISELDEEPRKRRRKGGPGPQASAANLEPLGKLRGGFSPNASADGSSNLSGHQQPSSQVPSVDMSAPRIHNPKPDAALDVMNLSQPTQHTQVGRETVATPKQLMSKAEDVGRNAVREFEYPMPPRSNTRLSTKTENTAHNDKFEGDLRKRKRTTSPCRHREGYKEGGHREDRDHWRDNARDNVLGRSRSPANSRKELRQKYPRGAHTSRVSGAKDDRVTYSERGQAPARYHTERQHTEVYTNRDGRGNSRLRDDHGPHHDDSLRERSHKGSRSYRRDRPASPRRSHHDRHSSRDHIRYLGDDRRHLGENELHSRNDIERRSWAEYQDHESRHRDTRYLHDEASRSAQYESHGFDPRQQSRSSGQRLQPEDRSNYRGHRIRHEAGKHRDDRYHTRDLNRH